jgi:uncharacterized protein (DUF2225 family)
MTTFNHTEVTCPCCGKKFETTILISTNTFGGQTTDFQSRAVGFSPLPLIINTCPQCGFSGGISDFEDSKLLPEPLKAKIRAELTPLIQVQPPDCGTKYEFAAHIAEWEDAGPFTIADLYLKAAWCANDNSQHEPEMKYRHLAIEYFQKWLDHTDLADPQRLTIIYLIGELYRRVGDESLARKWFDRAIDEAGADFKNQRIAEIAKQQRDDPQEFFKASADD